MPAKRAKAEPGRESQTAAAQHQLSKGKMLPQPTAGRVLPPLQNHQLSCAGCAARFKPQLYDLYLLRAKEPIFPREGRNLPIR